MSASDFIVTLLGTGVTTPRPDRFGASTPIEAGGQKLVIDAGRRKNHPAVSARHAMGLIDALLLTIITPTTSGIPDLWLTGWLSSFYARRTTAMRVIGPVGARTLMTHLERAYAADIKIRIEDEKLPPEGIATMVEEFHQDGVVYDRNGVKVIAFEVDHGDVIKPAYGYRVEYGGRAAVFSGDTRYNANVIKYGAGADLLVHEVAAARPELAPEAYIQRILAHHTTPREAGMVFAQTRPKLAVYTHLVMLVSDKVAPPAIDDIVRETRTTYDGPLEVGEDLMRLEIGDTVAVRRDLCGRSRASGNL